MLLIFYALLLGCLACVESTVQVNLHVAGDQEVLNPNMRYLMYDVNPAEGFNLRRDVFIRIANLVRKLNEIEAWTLVLPPFTRMSHWTSKLESEKTLPWSAFFEMANISILIPIIELDDYVMKVRRNNIDHVYYLQADLSIFDDDTVTTIEPNRYQVAECESEHAVDDLGFQPQLEHHELPGGYRRAGLDNIEGYFWNNVRLFAHRFDCLSVFASATSLMPFLAGSREQVIMLDRAEQLIHGELGEFSPQFWTVRRSMLFNRTLIDAALRYSKRHLASEVGALDDFYTALYSHYRKYWWNYRAAELSNQSGVLNEKGTLFGGPYVALHYRKGKGYDRAHGGHVPSVNDAARQVRTAIDTLRRRGVAVHFVYVASDASLDELQLFKRELYMADLRVAGLLSDAAHPDRVRASYTDGGVAIIEQLIATHAAHFIGTAYSTFTHRIQEERIIAGFDKESTFNVLCCDRMCPPNSHEDLEMKNGLQCARVSKWSVIEEQGIAQQMDNAIALRNAARRPPKRSIFAQDDHAMHEHESEEARRHRELLKHTEL